MPRSRMKLRSIRGPNWVEVRVRATITMENTRPTTVMMAAAIAVRICRAASGDPLSSQPGRTKSPANAARSSAYVAAKSTTAAATSTAGTSHRLVRSISRRQSEPRSSLPITGIALRQRTRPYGSLPEQREMPRAHYCRPGFPAHLALIVAGSAHYN